jgi:hypothetical protein
MCLACLRSRKAVSEDQPKKEVSDGGNRRETQRGERELDHRGFY